MRLAWVFYGLLERATALILLFWVCAAIATAQTPPRSHSSPVPRTIILPPKILAGEPATLAVIDNQGRLLPNVSVELSGGQSVKTDATGRAMFKVPGEPGMLAARAEGKGVASSTSVLPGAGAQNATQGAPPVVKVLSYPHVLAIHDRFALEGSGFRGPADLNKVYLNGEPCLVVASSPVSLVVLPGPRVPIGDVSLRVTVAGADAGQFLVSAVILDFSGPAEAVTAGSDGQLVVHVHGTTQPLIVEIRNGSPGVIQLANGNVQRVRTSGGAENMAPVDVKFVTGGNYAVSARLISASVAGWANPESVRKRAAVPKMAN